MTNDRYNAFLDRQEPAPPNASDGPLSGLTLAVKDIFEIAGQRTGGGNPQKLAGSLPAARTAPAVAALLEAGARFVGRTQTDELTFSLMGQNAHFPQPINPAAPDRVTGGSSSGSAAAVAGGLADVALGSDTGGSIRAPASFCGLIGLRTTHGAISLDGAMPLAPSFDTFGWFARDAATYGKVAAVLLPGDVDDAPPPRLLRIATLEELVLGTAEAKEFGRISRLVEELAGPAMTAAPLAHSLDELYWCFRRLQAYEAWALHGEWISAADRGLGPGVRERFAYGSTLGCDVATEETRTRSAFRGELAELLGRDGLLMLPTVPGAAPLRDASFDELQAYRERALRLLCLSGLSGYPQITLPLGRAEDAPFGLSLIGPPGSDRLLIRLGKTLLERQGAA